MNKEYDIVCPICSYVGKSRHKNICRPCYRKQYALRAPKKPCSKCGELRSLARCLCHKCYEFERRQKLIKEAKNDPIKAEKLKKKYQDEYLKTKASGFYKQIKRRVGAAITAILSRDPETDLDQKWYYDNIIDKNCVYCGIDEKTAKLVTGNNLHVDKKIPELGYKKDNCVPACKACNTAKLHYWSFEEACELGKVIASFYEKRKKEC